MNSTRDRAISLLGQGYSQGTVANALGVTASWISQLVDEDVVKEEVAQLRTAKLQERVEADNQLEGIENRALKLIGDKLPLVRSPMEAARIYALLNKATRKSAASNPVDDANSVATVNIVLPKAAANVFIQLNSNNQVVEVAGRSMATLPSRALPSLAASRAAAMQLPGTPVEVVARSITPEQVATINRQQAADSSKALERLKSITIETVINGVPCVL